MAVAQVQIMRATQKATRALWRSSLEVGLWTVMTVIGDQCQT